MTAALGALAVVAAAWGWGRALLPRELERGRAEETALSLGLGLAVLMGAGTLLSWLGLSLSLPLALVLVAAGPGAGLVQIRRRPRTPAPPLLPGPLRLLLTIWSLGTVLAVVALPLHTFDPLFHYAYKAKLLLAGSVPGDEAWTGMLDAAGQPARVGPFLTHPDYPLGVPWLMALAAAIGGGWSERWVQLPAALGPALLPWFAAAGLRPWGRRAAFWGALLTLSCPVLVVRDFGVQGDPLLGPLRGLLEADLLHSLVDPGVAAAVALASALLLRSFLPRGTPPGRRTAFLAGLALGSAALVKNEGLALALLGLLASAAVLLFRPRPGLRRVFGALALGALLVLGPTLGLRARLPSVDEGYARRLAPAAVAEAWSSHEPVGNARNRLIREDPELREQAPLRRHEVGRLLGGAFVDLRNFGILWPLLLLLLPAAWACCRRGTAFLALLLAGGWTLYGLVLLVTPWYLPDLEVLGIPERLLLHLLGPAALLGGLALSRGQQG